MLFLFLGCAPTAEAPPAPTFPEHVRSDVLEGLGIAEDSDGGVALRLGRRTRHYRADGRLVRVEPRAPEPDVAALYAEGGGNRAVVDRHTLVVEGERPCTLPVRGPHPNSAAETLITPGVDWPVPSAEGPVALAVGTHHAALAEQAAVLIVDLDRCVPLRVLPFYGRDHGDVAVALGDTHVLLATQEDTGYAVHRWSLAAGVREVSFALRPSALVAGPDGPSLVYDPPAHTTGGRLETPHGVVPLDGRGYTLGTRLLDLGPLGSVTLRDAAGTALASAAEGALYTPRSVTVDGDTVRISDGARTVALPGSGLPDGDDREAADAARQDATDAFAVRRELGAWVVRSGGAVYGVPLRAEGDVVRASPDGSVVVTQAADTVSAWRTADGKALWTRTVNHARGLTVGADWLAVTTSSGYSFVDPADGAPLGDLDATGLFAGDLFDAARVRRAPWAARPPSPHPSRAPAAASEVADEVPTPPEPTWPAGAHPAGDDGDWLWPTHANPVGSLGDGRVLVQDGVGFGVLGPDGTLLWWRARTGDVRAIDGVVVHARDGVLDGWDAATGALAWRRSGDLADQADGPNEVHGTAHGPLATLDAATGTMTLVPWRPNLATAWGWACPERSCTQVLHPEDLGIDDVAGDVRLTTTRRGRLLYQGGHLRATLRYGAHLSGGLVVDPHGDAVDVYEPDGTLVHSFPHADDAVADGDRVWVRTSDGILAWHVGTRAVAPLPLSPLPEDDVVLPEDGGPPAAGR